MLFQNKSVEYGNLGSGIAQTVQIVDIDIRRAGSFIQRYRPTSIKVANSTGGIVHVAVFTEKEHIKYLSDPSISDLYPINTNISETFSEFTTGEITKILVSGEATSSYTENLDINIIQD